MSLRLLSRAEVNRRLNAHPAARSAQIRRALLARRAMRPHLPWLIALYVIAVGALPVVSSVVDKGSLSAAAWVVLVVFWVGVPAVLWRIDQRRWRREVRVLPGLAPGCLACMYDLAGVPTADDGCTVCPECGAAWDLPGIDLPGIDRAG